MATRHWFKPKTYGYGATPTTWEGWTMTCGGVAIVLAASWYVLGAAPSTQQWLAWASIVVVTVVALAVVSYCKTDGTWRWRWGSRPDLR